MTNTGTASILLNTADLSVLTLSTNHLLTLYWQRRPPPPVPMMRAYSENDSQSLSIAAESESFSKSSLSSSTISSLNTQASTSSTTTASSSSSSSSAPQSFASTQPLSPEAQRAASLREIRAQYFAQRMTQASDATHTPVSATHTPVSATHTPVSVVTRVVTQRKVGDNGVEESKEGLLQEAEADANDR